MRHVSICRSSLSFAVITLLTLVLVLLFNRPQTLGQSTVAPTTQPAVPQSADRQTTELGVWHHFGEGSNPRPGEPRQSGVWRHFGKEENPPLIPRELPSPRTPQIGVANDMERLMLALVNQDRADPANQPETKGRAMPLRWNDRIAEVARAHSLDMLRQGYFGHIDPQGGTVATRVEAAGMEWQAVGENIAIYNSVAGAEAAFMNEPRFTKNHRGNILNPDYAEVGIGIVQAPDGRVYITQDFYSSPSGSQGR